MNLKLHAWFLLYIHYACSHIPLILKKGPTMISRSIGSTSVQATKLFCHIILCFLASCSLLDKNEDTLRNDYYWNQLVQDTVDSKTTLLIYIKNKNIHLYQQILSDSKSPELLSFWGKSLNFDSLLKKEIVKESIMEDLHILFGLKSDKKIVHAGIAHTYGYLFSTLVTPYGFKRQRWIAPTLNKAFSFSGNALSPQTKEGSLLSNITYFTGMLAFTENNDRIALKKIGNVSNEIKGFNYADNKIKTIHLREEFLNYAFDTAIVPFPVKNILDKNNYLLIYTLLDHQLNKQLLITAFPITEEAFKKIVEPSALGNKKPISIRYNAYVEGLMDQKLIGRRIIF